MKNHLLRPDAFPPPPELEAFVVERRFAQEFNVPGRPLDEWPHRKVVHYTTIMQVETEIAAERRNATDGATAASPPAAAKTTATEEAFQRMRASAQPPPMPPPAT